MTTQRSPHRAVWLLATVILLIIAAALPAIGQEATGPASHASADAFGVEARGDVAGGALGTLAVGPVPDVRMVTPPDAEPQEASVARVALAEGQVGTVDAVVVTAETDLQAGTAVATARTEALTLLAGNIAADALHAVSTTTCAAAGTPEEASEGTRFVGLTLGGELIDATPPPNTQVRIANDTGQGIAEVTLREVIPDEEGLGWTVRALRIVTLDPVTQAAAAEIIIGEAHSAVVCEGETTPPADDDRPDLAITKDTASTTARPGETITYDVAVTNRSEQTCTIFEVIDRLPEGFRFVEAGGALADATASVDGTRVRLRNPTGWELEPGAALEGSITARISSLASPGTYYNDVEARSTCGTARTGPTAPIQVSPTSPDETPRVGEVDRARTAIELSREVWDAADAAVLARSDLFPDALAAGVLAVEIDGPILVNPPQALRDDVGDELERLGVERVYLAGGPVALSPAVESALDDRGFETIRLDGENRFHTAYLVAEEVVELGGAVEHAVVARADLFPDALSANNVATYARAPILLTTTGGPVHEWTSTGLEEFVEGDHVWIAGETAAVGPQAELELRTQYDVTRLGGENRYDTALEFVEASLDHGAGVEPTLLASGVDFSDALISGPAAHRLGGVVTITDPQTLDNSAATRTYFERYADDIDTVIIVGGERAVSATVAREVAEIIR
jgi:uncharacterized repeat protein (TIGR01451 family)